MGTRAQFFVGNPMEPLEGGRLIGCIAWDGYPSGVMFLDELRNQMVYPGGPSAADFEAAVLEFAKTREDWTSAERGFPFPWMDNLFLTDYTYAFFDGGVQVACYHSGFIPWATIFDETGNENDDPFKAVRDALPEDFPVPAARSRPGEGKDSIIVIGVRP